MRVICIGAHPDDCEIAFGGTAAKFAASGHAVKFVSVTNGNAGHHVHSPSETAEIRKREAEEAARRLGIAETEVGSVPDGEVLPTLDARHKMVRRIRRWQADVVLTHRPWDYHPDHRYTSQLVQDSAYLVTVPQICPDTSALRNNPVFVYLEDAFHLPVPFAPDIAVDIDDVWDQKIGAMDAHASQFYEWLPWMDGSLEEVPENPEARRTWLAKTWTKPPTICTRAALARRYGGEQAREIRHAEAFQICEYGRRASPVEMDELFPR